MNWILYIIISIILIPLLILAAAFICYQRVFSVPMKCKVDVYAMPEGAQYDAHKIASHDMITKTMQVPYEPVEIMSDDNLKLYGKYYHTADNAPVQIMFHGYRSMAERDFSGGLRDTIRMGYNVLLVDQRAHGKSEGKCLTFGIKERYDCLAWVNYAVTRFGPSTQIALYGMSMGSATVLMAAGLPLPENVVAIVADCGYTSPSQIIKKVMGDMHYPLHPIYSLIRLGGKIFGRFDIEVASASDAMKSCNIPVLFIHGESDLFVPCDMSKENYRLCNSENKRLLTVPNAGHGLSYMEDKDAYLEALNSFLDSAFN